MARLDTITITGADDSVPVGELVRLVEKYPRAEVGILVGNHPGTPRFPTPKWIASLHAEACKSSSIIKLAVHMCGNWAKSFLTEVCSGLPYGLEWSRVQVNTGGAEHVVQLRNLRHNLVCACARKGAQVVFQDDGLNDDLFRWARDCRCFNVACLFDRSGGRGRSPSEWSPPLTGAYCGYAGGLSPDNVVAHLVIINELFGPWQLSAEHFRFWVDAETHLRSDDGKSFDLERAEAFLARATEYATRQEGSAARADGAEGLALTSSTCFPRFDSKGVSASELARELQTTRADLHSSLVGQCNAERELALARIALKGQGIGREAPRATADAQQLARLRAFQHESFGGLHASWDDDKVLAFAGEEVRHALEVDRSERGEKLDSQEDRNHGTQE